MWEKLKEDDTIYLLVVKVNLCAACRQHTSSSSSTRLKGTSVFVESTLWGLDERAVGRTVFVHVRWGEGGWMERARGRGGGWCLRLMVAVGGAEASRLLVKWKWLFSRIQDTWVLCWINVSDLLSESLSGESGGGGWVWGYHRRRRGERGAERGKEWEIVHQSGRARRPNQRDCCSSPHGSDAKSISHGNREGQPRQPGQSIWGKINIMTCSQSLTVTQRSSALMKRS